MKHDRTTLRILPEMELLAGVQSQTSWIQRMGPDGEGNKYFQALRTFFDPYKNHRAVMLSQKLTDAGFTYDAPPAFICHLGPLPDLKLQHDYSDYLLGRSGGPEPLEEFRLALRNLASESSFLSFCQDWETYLNGCLDKSRADFRQGEIENWLSNFFGWTAGEFHLIMAPSMFPGGGYGGTVTNKEGATIAFQVLCDWGKNEDDPVLPTGHSLENLTVHELSHFFVNPCIDAHPERIQNLTGLFEPVREIMTKQAYPRVDIFLYETVIRPIEILFARDFLPPETEAEILNFHKEWGFYLTEYVLNLLNDYQSKRDIYPTFKEFVPVLFDYLDLYLAEHQSLN